MPPVAPKDAKLVVMLEEPPVAPPLVHGAAIPTVIETVSEEVNVIVFLQKPPPPGRTRWAHAHISPTRTSTWQTHAHGVVAMHVPAPEFEP